VSLRDITGPLMARTPRCAWACLLTALLVFFPLFAANAEAGGEEPAALPPDADPMPAQGFEPGLLPALAALVPGLLLHGSGTFVAGDTDTGLLLLAAEGVGVASAATGLTILATTGASRKLAGLSVTLTAGGVGLFLTPMLADLYGAAVGGTEGAPALVNPRAQVTLGYRFIDDPHFEYSSLLASNAQLWLDRWRLGVEGIVAADDDNQRLRFEGDCRLLGPLAGERDARDGSALDVQLASTFHSYGTEGFRTLSFESSVAGRYDLARLGAPLRGSFAEAHLGYGLEWFDYDLPGVPFGEDTSEMLLLGFGWGVYLGAWPGDHGSVALTYDHRRDSYFGGLSSGFIGHFGARGEWHLVDEETDNAWALGAMVKVGSALAAGLDLGYRWGSK